MHRVIKNHSMQVTTGFGHISLIKEIFYFSDSKFLLFVIYYILYLIYKQIKNNYVIIKYQSYIYTFK